MSAGQVTFCAALRAWWRGRALWTCFIAKSHRPCGGCTPACGRCAFCHRNLTDGGSS